MKRLFFFLPISFLLLSALYYFYLSFGFVFLLKDRQVITLVLKEHILAPVQKELLVEVVNQPETITAGLSERPDLQTLDGRQLDGMLFVFQDKSKQNFWMKDMLFDLDICWLADSRFLSCARGVKSPETMTSLEIYSSPRPANFVLETKPSFFSDKDLDLQLFLK